MEVSDKKLSDKEFFREREEVLTECPAGKEVDLNEAIQYHRSLAREKHYVLKVDDAIKRGEILLHGAGGADTLERHSELMKYLQDEGQADIAATWIDSLTRNHHYEEAKQAVKEAEETGKVVLNGLPIVYYGVASTRKMTEAVKIPVCVHGNGSDMRLIAEIALAGGHTATTLGGALCAFWSYTGNMLLETIIRRYQYIYRLEGHYEEKGVPICAQTIGSVAGLIPPSLTMVSSIIEALIAAGQGARHVLLHSDADGNLAQDIASVVTLRKLGREYMNRLGHEEVVVYVGNHHPRVRFPTDDAQAFALTGWSAIIAALAKSDLAHFFTIDEGRQIPRKEKNAATHRHIKMLINMLKNQNIDLLRNREVEIEAEMAEREVRAMLDRTIELGNGDIVVGAIRAVEAGVLDQPFATTKRTMCKVLGVRDAENAVRYLDHGNLPFAANIVQFHKEKIAERARKEGREIGYETIIGDIFAPGRGRLLSDPSWQAEEAAATIRRNQI